MLNGLGLGNDLVDEISAQEFGEKFPSDSGKRDRINWPRNPLKDLFQDPLNGLERLPLMRV